MEPDVAIRLRSVSLRLPARQRRVRRTALQDGVAQPSLARRHVAVLEDVSLTIRRGQRVGVVGDNGAGKTALLRVIAGIYPPTEGTCETAGRMSCLFDTSLHGYGDATALEFVMLAGLTRGLRRREIDKLIPAVYRLSEIGRHIHRPTRALSDGLRTRLVFAIAMCVEWDVLLLDEEIGTSDLRFREKARRRIQEAPEAKTLMVCSHDSRVIRDFCDQAVWIHEGRIRASGDVDELLAAYRARVGVKTGWAAAG